MIRSRPRNLRRAYLALIAVLLGVGALVVYVQASEQSLAAGIVSMVACVALLTVGCVLLLTSSLSLIVFDESAILLTDVGSGVRFRFPLDGSCRIDLDLQVRSLRDLSSTGVVLHGDEQELPRVELRTGEWTAQQLWAEFLKLRIEDGSLQAAPGASERLLQLTLSA